MLKIVKVSKDCHSVLRGNKFLCCIIETESGARLEYMGELVSYSQLYTSEVKQILDYMLGLEDNQ